MKIGGEGRLAWVKNRHWRQFGSEIGVKDKMVTREKQRVFALIRVKADELRKVFLEKGYSGKIIDKVIGYIKVSTARE